ncbi:MAG: Asp23/Gls24 family envelope stress response protein [Chloroflexota bacterium]
MSNDERSLGKIEVSPVAIASIATHAIKQCYGVVGMANKSLVEGIAHLLTRDSHQGVEVHVQDALITLDVYVIVEYGMRISAVANSVKNTVSFHVEEALGIPVDEVNVFVQGLRFSDPDRD